MVALCIVIGFDMLDCTVVLGYSIIFICIVQISSLGTASIGQSLLTLWSHPQQSWMFALIVAL